MCHHSGYKGRISINEMVVVDEALSGLISEGANEQQMKKYIAEQAFLSLADDGMQKVAQGLTTLEEYIRVVYN